MENNSQISIKEDNSLISVRGYIGRKQFLIKYLLSIVYGIGYYLVAILVVTFSASASSYGEPGSALFAITGQNSIYLALGLSAFCGITLLVGLVGIFLRRLRDITAKPILKSPLSLIVLVCMLIPILGIVVQLGFFLIPGKLSSPEVAQKFWAFLNEKAGINI